MSAHEKNAPTGALEQKNFDTYQVLRRSDLPDVVEVSYAIFAATGAGVRQVPLQPDRVLRAIQQKA